MNKEQIYSIWAPEGPVWSKWVKPVLFAYLTDATRPLADSEPPEWGESVPEASSDTGMVIDLDGPRGVFFGMRMARKGYYPVPLYNACPKEQPGASPDDSIRLGLQEGSEEMIPPRYPPVVNGSSILAALAGAAEELSRLPLPPSAPPAFLLDWRRGGVGARVSVGMFDNRSVVFPSDFPSVSFLRDRGIRAMVVISETHTPDFDLSAVLREWAMAGVDIRIQVPGPIWDPKPVSLPAPSWLQKLLFWLQTNLGLQKNSTGGYGRVRRSSG